MPKHVAITMGLLMFSLASPGCKDSKTSTESVSTAASPSPATASPAAAPKADARTAFPNQIGRYAFDGWKTKKHDWGHAYSASYKSPEKDKLKVVINDAPPKGREAWLPFFAAGNQFKGKPMALDQKPGKLTMMVRVGDRFRVDFKTRSGDHVLLRAVAEDFDFGAVKRLAP